MLDIALILLLCILAFLIWASADIRSKVYISSFCKADIKEKIVAITFDDGPSSDNTLKVLDVLRKYNVKATFFLVGENIEKYKDVARKIVAEGHMVANHSWSHANTFPLFSSDVIAGELAKTDVLLSEISNKENKLFRPPFGVTNPLIAKAVSQSGLLSVGWSVRSFDTMLRIPRKMICKRVVRKTKPGAIILLHDRVSDSDLLLEGIVSNLLSLGFSFVTLDKFVKYDVYEK